MEINKQTNNKFHEVFKTKKSMNLMFYLHIPSTGDREISHVRSNILIGIHSMTRHNSILT